MEVILIDYESGQMLKSLNISYNRLQTFNYTYNKSMALNVLNLEGNDLYQLDTISPSNFPNLTTIYLSKNRFDCEYAQRFVKQWNHIAVIGDPCDQKGNIIEPDIEPDSSILYITSIALFGCIVVTTAIWIIRCKVSTKEEQQIVGQKNIQWCSSDQYEEPLPFKEPIYYEIDYSEARPPNSSHAYKQYDHLNRDPMPLSPIRLHYDNLKKSNKKPPLHIN